MKCTMDFLGLDGSKVTAHSLRDGEVLIGLHALGAEAIANATGIMASGFRKSLAETRSRIASLFM